MTTKTLTSQPGLGVVTVNTSKPPDTRNLTLQHELGVVTVKPPTNINKTVKKLRKSYEKGYDNVDYLLGFKPIPKSDSEEESEEESKAASKSKKSASKAVPPRNRTLDNRVIFTKLKHDYQDPNRDKLQTAKTKQLPIDDYFKIIGREKEVTDFTNKVDEAKYNKPDITAIINKNENKFIKQMQSSRQSPIVRGYVGKKKIYK